jgi:hypothetical protein
VVPPPIVSTRTADLAGEEAIGGVGRQPLDPAPGPGELEEQVDRGAGGGQRQLGPRLPAFAGEAADLHRHRLGERARGPPPAQGAAGRRRGLEAQGDGQRRAGRHRRRRQLDAQHPDRHPRRGVLRRPRLAARGAGRGEDSQGEPRRRGSPPPPHSAPPAPAPALPGDRRQRQEHHPGLLDKKRVDEGSAKLDLLSEQLGEVLDEGHKVLVFSQFTSLLAILRRTLDRQGTVYEYLDGGTRDRRRRVERFQTDPDCRLFLISLKAGGLGLNLTAADYVYILDPWWNPAVEAQAVDRAHRIGQSRPVFAYRLIARDTVEEKILQLQAGKRELAEAIVSADQSLIRNLTAEDLRRLLS